MNSHDICCLYNGAVRQCKLKIRPTDTWIEFISSNWFNGRRLELFLHRLKSPELMDLKRGSVRMNSASLKAWTISSTNLTQKKLLHNMLKCNDYDISLSKLTPAKWSWIFLRPMPFQTWLVYRWKNGTSPLFEKKFLFEY